ncbi:MAG: hypothetical protein GY839_14070, partial [candidate division Zixibacteria bacterium]|nr:hypothetical protein [candidate division Zixibacteria bacterium]
MFILRKDTSCNEAVGALVSNAILALMIACIGIVVIATAVPSVALAGSVVPAVVIDNVRIFDGENVIPDTRVVIKGDIIVGVGMDSPAPDGAALIDGQSMTLLPGLLDAHVHVWSEEQLKQTLVFGVTSVVDMFMNPATMKAIKDKQAVASDGSMATLISAGI